MAEKQEALVEAVRNLSNVQGSWNYQVFNNIDELVYKLRGMLGEADHRAIELFVELGIKHPIRRQLGRVTASIKILKELKVENPAPNS